MCLPFESVGPPLVIRNLEFGRAAPLRGNRCSFGTRLIGQLSAEVSALARASRSPLIFPTRATTAAVCWPVPNGLMDQRLESRASLADSGAGAKGRRRNGRHQQASLPLRRLSLPSWA